ncbi:MAG: FkbM family methyltransferase [Planctomycetaceae bacterium]|nr:FkbM family methyltransferase [Planctomycetaceae bacterium]
MIRFLWRAYRARFRDQRAELHELLSAIEPGDTVVDVGAHKGSYLYWLSLAVRGGQVVAFEPQPALAEYLRTQCRTLGLSNVTVEAVGVSDRTGSLTLHVPGQTASQAASFEGAVLKQGECQSYSVPVVTLDDYFHSQTQRITAIKIDAEGHELAVLRGARRILTEDVPCLTVECEARHLANGSVTDVLQYLESLGYQGDFVNQRHLCPIAEFNPDTHQRAVGAKFWDAKDYCNNFVLRKRAA